MLFRSMALKREVSSLRISQQKEFGFDSIIGQSPVMQEIFSMINRVAKSDATTVLLQGESGTGKDLAAKVIHYSSKRKDSSFLEINCTALPETLLESELLGHEKGAFTDAKTLKRGLFELADGGTIFLDEIGDMKLSMQVKLLRIIEDKTFKRIGGTEDITVDTRIIAASNRNLEETVKEGGFREDLYYRLKIIPITLPPLRRRGNDILLLAKFFIDRFNREFKKKIKKISKEAEQLLLNYYWPGNVRELRNVIERSLILEDAEIIIAEHLPPELHEGTALMSKEGDQAVNINMKLPLEGVSLAAVEQELIKQALEMKEDNQTQAAKLLGLTRDALRYRMKKFGFLEAMDS